MVRGVEEGLSDRSRYLRFLGPVRTLSPRMLDLLVDDVDGHRHVALVLVVLPPRVPEPTPAGTARFIRFASDPAVAEAAVTVGDEFQGLGAGTLLLSALRDRALDVGVTMFTATVASENEVILHTLARVGRLVRREHVGYGVSEIQVELS
jgi:GNAT superfamily N-acetyltransferase